MLLRPFGAQFARAPGTARTLRSISLLSQQAFGRPQDLHRNATRRYESPAIDARQQLSKSYSNYAPRGPPPYYDVYGQPPKSKGSRLKDMVIGSVLTIVVYIGYKLYSLRDVLKQAEEEVNYAMKMDEIYSFYDQLLEQAGDKGSPDFRERKRELFKERAMALVRAVPPEDQPIYELGPLPTLPEDDARRAQVEQTIEESDTLVLIREAPSYAAEEHPLRPRHIVAVAINAGADDLGDHAFSEHGDPKVHEILCRAKYMLAKLHKEGTIDGVAFVTVYTWDAESFFVYDNGMIRTIMY